MSSYMLVRRDQMKVDGFTYGDWRQYVAFLHDEENAAYCCRFSSLPATLAMIGFVALTLPLMALFFAYNGVEIIWAHVLITAAVSLVLLVPWLITCYSPYRLVVKVSDKMLPDEDGVWTRSF